MKRVIFLLVAVFLAGCGLRGQRREVINYTDHAFCRVEEVPNLSIYAPWDKKTKHIKLPPNGSITIRDRGEKYILHIWSCDGRYMVSNYNHRPESDDPWILSEMDVWDTQEKYEPTPRPTRTPAVVTLKNETGKSICSLRLSPPEWKGYQFGENILGDVWEPGQQIVLHEPAQIRFAVYALGIDLCDGTGYITEEISCDSIMTVTLRGAEQDTHGLLVERQGDE